MQGEEMCAAKVADNDIPASEEWDRFHGEIKSLMTECLSPGEEKVHGVEQPKLLEQGVRGNMKIGDMNFLGVKAEAPKRIHIRISCLSCIYIYIYIYTYILGMRSS